MAASFQRVVIRILLATGWVAGTCVTLPASAASGGMDPTREFITTCTYGALAGGLVGAATLAFSDDPGNKIGNVAKGASLGLYVGIALGLYMISGPSGGEDDAAAAAAAGITKIDAPVKHSVAKSIQPPSFAVYPMLSERGVEGARAQFNLLSF